MKNEFVYGNGKVSFYDDKTMKMEQRDYQDNISEVLATENIVEELEKEKKIINNAKAKLIEPVTYLKKQIDTFGKKKMKKIGKRLLLFVLVNSLISILLFLGHPLSDLAIILFWASNFILFLDLADTIFTSKKEYIQELDPYQQELDGYLQEELSLNDMLTEYKNRLKRLLNDKSTTHEEEMSTELQTINYQENLKRQKRYLELMKICGKNKEHFIESYQNETLVGELSGEYPEDEVNIIYGFAEDEAFKLNKQKH